MDNDTLIQMLAFVPSGLRWACSSELEMVELFTDAGHVGFEKSAADLAGTSQEIADPLEEELRLEVWQIEGSLGDMNQDIILPESWAPEPPAGKSFRLCEM